MLGNTLEFPLINRAEAGLDDAALGASLLDPEPASSPLESERGKGPRTELWGKTGLSRGG